MKHYILSLNASIYKEHTCIQCFYFQHGYPVLVLINPSEPSVINKHQPASLFHSTNFCKPEKENIIFHKFKSIQVIKTENKKKLKKNQTREEEANCS